MAGKEKKKMIEDAHRYKGIPRSIIEKVALENKRAAIVCGLGSSLEGIERKDGVFYIGVNHICKYFTPDIVYIADLFAPDHDYRKQYGEELGMDANERVKHMVESNSRWVFTTSGYVDFPNSEKVYVRGKDVGNSKSALDAAIRNHYVWFKRTSVIGAISIALMFGFNHIGLLGFDLFGGHAYKPKTRHLLSSNEHIETLNKLCRLIMTYAWERGIGIENLSKHSRITSIPKREPDAFLTDYLN